jgi:hypothetical protein
MLEGAFWTLSAFAFAFGSRYLYRAYDLANVSLAILAGLLSGMTGWRRRGVGVFIARWRVDRSGGQVAAAPSPRHKGPASLALSSSPLFPSPPRSPSRNRHGAHHQDQ